MHQQKLQETYREERKDGEMLQLQSTSSKNPKMTYREFFCGWTVGCIETCLFYPIGKLIMRQQLHNVTMLQGIEQLRLEGIRNLYRGLLPPLIQATTNKSIMFGTFATYQRFLGCNPNTSTPSIARAFSAFLAGATEATMCPLERVQTLLQTSEHLKRFKNTGHAFRVLITEYSFKELYRGYSTVLLRNGCSDVVFFSFRTPISEIVFRYCHYLTTRQVPTSTSTFSRTSPHFIFANFVSGALLGAFISTLFFPLNVVKTRMQAKLGGEFHSPIRTLKIILSERNGSIRQLFCGVKLSFVLSLVGWGFGNTTYEMLLHGLFGGSTSFEQ